MTISYAQMSPEPSKYIICISPIHETGECLQPKGASTALLYLLQQRRLLQGSGSTQGSCSVDSWLMGCTAPAWTNIPRGSGPSHSRAGWRGSQPQPWALGYPLCQLPVSSGSFLLPRRSALMEAARASLAIAVSYQGSWSLTLEIRAEHITLSQECSASPPSSDPAPPFWLCMSHFCSGIMLVPSISVRW